MTEPNASLGQSASAKSSRHHPKITLASTAASTAEKDFSALFYQALVRVQDLFSDDPDAPEIGSLAEGVRPFWAGDAPMLALLDDPRWQEIESDFARVRRTLRCFAPLGPRHAGLARRFARLSCAIFGLDSAWERVKGFDPETEDWKNGFFSTDLTTLGQAARRSGVLFTAPEFVPATEAQFREVEETLAEGIGLDPEAYRAGVPRLRRDTRALVSTIWQQMGVARPEPKLIFYDRFVLPGTSINFSATLDALYRPPTASTQERLVFSLPRLNAMLNEPRHGCPDLPADLPLDKVMPWEPCFRSNFLDYDPATTVIHETTHALALRVAEPLDLASPCLPGLKAFYAEQNLPLPEALTWVGLTPEVAGLKTALFVGLHLFDEMLTEAAALELREKIVAQIPKSLVLTREDPWYATAQERNYRNGSDVVAELLGGQSALAVITSDNPLKKLVVGIEVRLSASAAQTVLDLLLDNSKFYGDSNLQLSSSVNSPWAALSGRLRYLMVEDDKAKRRAQAKARRAD